MTLFAPAAPPGTRFPGVVFAHGQRGPVAVYSATLSHLASHGFFVVAPRGSVDFTCPACTYAQLEGYIADVVDAATWLAGNARCDATRGVGLFGHSLGGGVSIIAAARMRAAASGARVAGVLALAPATGDVCAFEGGPAHGGDDIACVPHAAAAALGHIPLLVLAGERDRACPVEANARRIFVAASAPAALRVLRRGTHCFTEMPGNLFGSECGVAPASADGVNVSNASAWGAAALRATRVVLAPEEGSSWDVVVSMQAAQLAVARRSAAAFFAAHAAGRQDANALTWAAGTRASPWLFADALARLTAVK